MKNIGFLSILFLIFFVNSHSQTVYYVDPNIGDDAYNGLSLIRGSGLYGPKKHIQSAINDASSNSIIILAAWTYDEHISLNKPLKLQAATNAAVIIQPTSLPTGSIFTINESSTSPKVIQGITFKSYSPLGEIPVSLISGSKYVTIQNCTVNSEGTVNQGISLNGTYSNITIQNCKFILDDNDDGIDFNPEISDLIASSFTISTDTFVVSGTNHTAIKFGAIQSSTLSNNIFGSQVQINIVNNNSASITINNNQFTPTNPSITHQGGIIAKVLRTGYLSSLTVTGNDFINNDFGILFDASFTALSNIAESSISISNNKFSGNIYHVLYNKNIYVAYTGADTNINATNNYWGSDNGPSHISNTYNIASQGEPVSDYVNFTPWLKTSKYGSSFAPVLNNSGSKYSSIQSAITNSVTGSTITSLGGTFSENITIPDTKQLTLNGNGYLISDSTTIIGSTVGSPTISITNTTGTLTTQVIINGFNIKSKGSAFNEYPLQITDSSKYVTIRNCKINSTGAANSGIYLSGSFDNLTIGGTSSSYGNLFLFDDIGTDVAVNFNPAISIFDSTLNLLIQYNSFIASGLLHCAMKFGALQNSTISYNTIGSIVNLLPGDLNTNNVTFTYNTFAPSNPSITHLGGLQISQQGTGNLANMSVTYNDFINNDFGIWFDNTILPARLFESTVNINYNKFANNTFGITTSNKGLLINLASAPDTNINAKYNYWNNNNGPTHSSNTYNSGNQGEPISDYLNFTPWLLNSKTGSSFSPTTTNETTPKYYPSIQAAVSATTSAYKIITVQPATYKETVTINQPLTLLGSQANVDPTYIVGESPRSGNETIIECENIRDYGISIASNSVTINGFTLQNPVKAGISVNKGASLDSCYIKYNRVINNSANQSGSTGILFSRNQNYYFKLCQLSYNLIKNIGSSSSGLGGIVFEGRPDYDIDSSIAIVIDHNKVVSTYGNGISLRVSKGASVTNNSITDNMSNSLEQSGIEISFANNALISLNSITTSFSPLSEYYGIFLNEFKNCSTLNNTINGNNEKITKGIKFNAGNAAPLHLDNYNNIIQNNSIKNCNEGIRITKDPFAVMYNNLINNNEISANINYGINNLSSQNIDAANNYWGSDNGPQHSTNLYNTGNQGNPVSDSVDFIPWRKTSMSGQIFLQPTTLVSPVNNISLIGSNPILKWNKLVNPTSYQLQVSSDTNFSSLKINQTGITDTIFSTSSVSLANDITYYWRVNVTKAGATSQWSTVNNFTIGLKSPTNLSPTTNTINVAALTTFTWDASFGATAYNLQVTNNAATWTNPIVSMTSITSSTFTLSTPLTNNTIYYWRVNSTNGIQTSQWSSANTFSTIIAPPAATTLLTPTDTSTNLIITPTLSWNAVPTAASYAFQISTSSADWSNPVMNISLISGASYHITNPLSNNTTYYWRVNATNIGGTSTWSNVFKFTTIVAIPSTPTPISPINSVTGQIINPPFTWNISSNAISYNLQVSTISNDWNNPTINVTGITSPSYTPTNSLLNSTIYYWRVNAINSAGTSGWSSQQSFTTIIAVPSTPSLLSPAEGVTGQLILTPFTWSASTNATNYTLQISASSSNWTLPVLNINTITSPSYTLTSGLINSTTYYWRVNAINAGGNSEWSTVRSFTTIIAVPTIPNLVSPTNSSQNIIKTPTFQWNASIGAVSYNLQVSVSNDFSSSVINTTNLSSNSYTIISGLNFGTNYYWRVCATNAGGQSQWSETWMFTTTLAPPASPTLVSPTNNENNVSSIPTFSWNTSNGANYYTIQISRNPLDWTNPETYRTYLTKNSFSITVPALTNNTKYYWRVNALNAGGTSEWSTVWNFTTVIAPPLTPSLTSPTNNMTNTSINQSFSWGAVSNASTYHLQISSDINFYSTLFDQSNLTLSSQTISGFANNTRYYWRVRANNAGGFSEWSSTYIFTTIPLAPGIPELKTPENGSSISNSYTEPFATFVWNSAENAATYQLQVSQNPSFNLFFIDQSGITDTYFLTGGVKNVKYYWRVRATNGAGTSSWSSIWNFNSILLGIEKISEAIPDNYKLDQNYPNPFNPSTNIIYSIPEENFVRLFVFDTYGKEIEMLVNKRQSPGTYLVTWRPENLPSGVYFYRIQSGKYISMKKMLFIR